VSVKLRLASVVAALLLPIVVLAVWVRATHSQVAPVEQIDLPRQVGPWVVVADEEFSADVVERAGVDSYLLRTYEAPGRVPIWLYVGVYAAFRSSGGKYHDPETCYPVSGWEVLDYRALALDLSGAETLHAQGMKLEKEGRRRLVNYWFQPAGRWPRVRAAEELARVLDAMRGSPQYAFVRLSSPMGAGSEEDASRDLAEFAAAIAGAVRTAVDELRVADEDVIPAAM
jgi:EpsI family protein